MQANTIDQADWESSHGSAYHLAANTNSLQVSNVAVEYCKPRTCGVVAQQSPFSHC